MKSEASNRVVHRCRIFPHRETQHLLLPINAVVLHVAIKPHDDFVSLWALCPAGQVDEEMRRFWCVGTGWDVLPGPSSRLEHIGTAIEVESATVWHVFEEFAP